MKALALVPAVALAAFAFVAPPRAEAADHSRGYSHSYSRGYRHYAPSYGYRGYGAAPYYRSNLHYRNRYYAPRYYGGYYDPYYTTDYYAPGYYGGYYGAGYGYCPPPVRYFRPRPRAHVGVFFGF